MLPSLNKGIMPVTHSFLFGVCANAALSYRNYKPEEPVKWHTIIAW